MKLLLLGTLLTLATSAGLANTDEDVKEGHPCHKIKAACEAAGFIKGHHKEKKGLYKDCMQPIMQGQTVAGVTVAPADLEACKAKKAEHHEKKK